MENIPELFSERLTLFLIIILFLALWETAWKMISMWKSARRKQLAWFICLGIFNTLGILPIVYLLLYRKEPAA